MIIERDIKIFGYLIKEYPKSFLIDIKKKKKSQGKIIIPKSVIIVEPRQPNRALSNQRFFIKAWWWRKYGQFK